MTDAERDAVVAVVMEVDGGCSDCITSAFEDLWRLLPDMDWMAGILGHERCDSYMLGSFKKAEEMRRSREKSEREYKQRKAEGYYAPTWPPRKDYGKP